MRIHTVPPHHCILFLFCLLGYDRFRHHIGSVKAAWNTAFLKNNLFPDQYYLEEQSEPEAKSLAIKLELFTNGSLNIFAHETNVDIKSRILSFNIFNLGKQLKTMGLLVITDAIINRVNENWRKGKRTHDFIDEIHVIFENEESATFFASAWRQFRKRDAYPTGITQNVKYLL